MWLCSFCHGGKKCTMEHKYVDYLEGGKPATCEECGLRAKCAFCPNTNKKDIWNTGYGDE